MLGMTEAQVVDYSTFLKHLSLTSSVYLLVFDRQKLGCEHRSFNP